MGNYRRKKDYGWDKGNYANRGMSFENTLNDMHLLYKAMGRGWIVKQYPKSHIVSHDEHGSLAKVTGNATVDYIGCVDGKFVAFDAKDCAENKIALDRLQLHQLQDLLDIDRMGGDAFVLVRFERARCYIIPVRAWKSALDAHRGLLPETYKGWRPAGKASIHESDLPAAWATNGVDWLNVEGVKG